ncbi:MAG: TetR/AcrR family transcriptional regulator [Desulfobacterales bacterium]
MEKMKQSGDINHNNTYKNILDSTAKLMVEKGYHGTSIRMISEEVGIQSSTLFYYFKNKDDILRTMLAELTPGFINELERIVENDSYDGIQKLGYLFYSYLGQLPEKRDALKVFFSESKYLVDENKALMKQTERNYLKLIEKILVQIRQEHPEAISGINIRVFAMVIYGICNWSLTWYQKDGKFSINEMVDQFMKILHMNDQKSIESVLPDEN